MVGINTGAISNSEVAPFGGVKQSGLVVKVQNSASKYVEMKYLCVDLSE